MPALVTLPLVACIGPFADVDHERESAVITSTLVIGERSFAATGETWSADPSAGCEVSEAREGNLHEKGTLRFVFAGDEAEPIAFGADVFVAPDDRVTAYFGLHARGHADWASARDRCAFQLTSTDYDGRAFGFDIDCTFERAAGAETLVVRGHLETGRCFDPTAISLRRAKDLASGIAGVTIELSSALANDPVGFAKEIALLPLYAIGPH